MNILRCNFIWLCAIFLVPSLVSPVTSHADGLEAIKQAVRENTKKPAELEQLCEAGDAESCIILAALFTRGKGVEKNKAKTEVLYKKACNIGNQDGCFFLAIYYLNPGIGIRKQIPAAKKLSESACDQSHEPSCNLAALHYFSGWFSLDHKRDIGMAEKYYERVCDLGNGGGCIVLSEIYGMSQFHKKDMKRSRDYYDRACKLYKRHNAKAYADTCYTVCLPKEQRKAYLFFGGWVVSNYCEIM